jgi:hypothetical protein
MTFPGWVSPDVVIGLNECGTGADKSLAVFLVELGLQLAAGFSLMLVHQLRRLSGPSPPLAAKETYKVKFESKGGLCGGLGRAVEANKFIFAEKCAGFGCVLDGGTQDAIGLNLAGEWDVIVNQKNETRLGGPPLCIVQAVFAMVYRSHLRNGLILNNMAVDGIG